jgi:hypothetical protein
MKNKEYMFDQENGDETNNMSICFTRKMGMRASGAYV